MVANATREQGTAHWARMVRADDVDVARANQQLKQSIADGATGIAMVFEGAHNAFGYGLPARPDTIKNLLQGINLQGLHLRLDNHPHGAIISNSFIEFLQHNDIHPQETKITFGIDSTASLATCGKLKMSLAALKASQPQSMSAFFSSGLPGVILEADGRPYHHAGASRSQELGAMLCVVDAHLDMVEAGRHPIAHALPHIGFSTALDGNVIAGLVKLRTLDNLWQRLQLERGIKQPLSAPIHVETSRRMLSSHNFALNVMRSQLAALAAISGGAVSLSILPACTVLGLPAATARHDVVMSQLVLALENSDLNQYTPSLRTEVEELSQRAWAQYQSFKEAGGVMACLVDGSLAQQLAETHERRLTRSHEIIALSSHSCDEHKNFGRTSSDIYAEEPISAIIEGIPHCQPLTPVHEVD